MGSKLSCLAAAAAAAGGGRAKKLKKRNKFSPPPPHDTSLAYGETGENTTERYLSLLSQDDYYPSWGCRPELSAITERDDEEELDDELDDSEDTLALGEDCISFNIAYGVWRRENEEEEELRCEDFEVIVEDDTVEGEEEFFSVLEQDEEEDYEDEEGDSRYYSSDDLTMFFPDAVGQEEMAEVEREADEEVRAIMDRSSSIESCSDDEEGSLEMATPMTSPQQGAAAVTASGRWLLAEELRGLREAEERRRALRDRLAEKEAEWDQRRDHWEEVERRLCSIMGKTTA